MNVEKIVKESKVIMLVTLITGIALLAAGILFRLFDVKLISNNRAIIGLSFIPLSAALIYYIKLWRLTKSPRGMKNIIVSESDERLVAQKNEADATAFKILQGALFLTYMGYTLTVPEDIFESVGWWILLGLLFLSYVSQGILLSKTMAKANNMDKDE